MEILDEILHWPFEEFGDSSLLGNLDRTVSEEEGLAILNVLCEFKAENEPTAEEQFYQLFDFSEDGELPDDQEHE